MSEVEYKGIKFRGGKLLFIFPLLGAIGGSVWAGFEGYARWVSMEDQISSYTAPDLSGFQKQLGDFNATIKVTDEKIDSLGIKLDSEISNMNQILQSEISTALQLITSAQDDVRQMKNDVRSDINNILDQISSVDKRSRDLNQETRGSTRTSENDMRTLIQHAEDRFDSKRTAIESDANRRNEALDAKLKELEDRLRDMLTRALNNPLAGQ
tara:strand:+ start:18 stop:650 length:633 start_codon:yes stop_codon:yes gene_type:complete